jgi:VanZ family protein
MTGSADGRPRDSQDGHPGRRARGAVIAWTLIVVAASLVDPWALAELIGASPTAGSGAGGAAAFAAAHLVAYGVLAWLLVDGLGSDMRGLRAVLAAAVAAAAIGVGVELLQAPVAARTASAADALVNAAGATAGAVLRVVLAGR